jgi:uncharacterized protein YndB with AHSA1/START domain
MGNDHAKGRIDSASKLIPAPAEQIYAAFADGKTLMRWLPPPNMTGRALEYQFCEGGRYRIELRYRDSGQGTGKTTGDSDISSGCFMELVPGRTIRQTVEFESEDAALARAMTMTWNFVPLGEATEVTVTAQNVPAAIAEDDHLEGLNSSLGNLARFVGIDCSSFPDE